ncbi:hypothetical protein HDZ31DRAFT_71685 [Schizophyllum fasciatum]
MPVHRTLYRWLSGRRRSRNEKLTIDEPRAFSDERSSDEGRTSREERYWSLRQRYLHGTPLAGDNPNLYRPGDAYVRAVLSRSYHSHSSSFVFRGDPANALHGDLVHDEPVHGDSPLGTSEEEFWRAQLESSPPSSERPASQLTRSSGRRDRHPIWIEAPTSPANVAQLIGSSAASDATSEYSTYIRPESFLGVGAASQDDDLASSEDDEFARPQDNERAASVEDDTATSNDDDTGTLYESVLSWEGSNYSSTDLVGNYVLCDDPYGSFSDLGLHDARGGYRPYRDDNYGAQGYYHNGQYYLCGTYPVDNNWPGEYGGGFNPANRYRGYDSAGEYGAHYPANGYGGYSPANGYGGHFAAGEYANHYLARQIFDAYSDDDLYSSRHSENQTLGDSASDSSITDYGSYYFHGAAAPAIDDFPFAAHAADYAAHGYDNIATTITHDQIPSPSPPPLHSQHIHPRPEEPPERVPLAFPKERHVFADQEHITETEWDAWGDWRCVESAADAAQITAFLAKRAQGAQVPTLEELEALMRDQRALCQAAPGYADEELLRLQAISQTRPEGECSTSAAAAPSPWAHYLDSLFTESTTMIQHAGTVRHATPFGVFESPCPPEAASRASGELQTLRRKRALRTLGGQFRACEQGLSAGVASANPYPDAGAVFRRYLLARGDVRAYLRTLRAARDRAARVGAHSASSSRASHNPEASRTLRAARAQLLSRRRELPPTWADALDEMEREEGRGRRREERRARRTRERARGGRAICAGPPRRHRGSVAESPMAASMAGGRLGVGGRQLRESQQGRLE